MKTRVRRPRRAVVSKFRRPGFEPLEARHVLAAVPLISEVMAANDGVLQDQDGDNSDWLELTNAGDAAVNLAGWHLTDNAGNLTKWTLPAETLNPGAFLIVFASSKDRAIAGQELHTNFSLGSGGEYLGLVQPDGVTIASQYTPDYPQQYSNISFGMRTDGGGIHPGELRYFSPPTPGATNAEGYLGVTAAPTFSVPHGFYSTTQNVTLTSTTPGAVIRYTTDGSEPTAASPNIYTSPLAISHITVLRAAAFAPGYLESPAETETYLFTNDVLTQTRPSSYPTSWGTAPAFPIFGLPAFNAPGDYDIDPEVVNNPNYTADFLAGLTSIPSVSLVMDVTDLFGVNGIYSNPWERGDAWERATSIELINPDGSPGFQINASAEMLGNASRQPFLAPKHSFQINFKSQFGDVRAGIPDLRRRPRHGRHVQQSGAAQTSATHGSRPRAMPPC